MAIKLNPSTTYSFLKEDLDFVLELAKVGHVHLLSDQVTLLSEKNGLSFKTYGNDSEKGCDGLKLPDNWFIEGIYTKGEQSLSITFRVKN